MLPQEDGWVGLLHLAAGKLSPRISPPMPQRLRLHCLRHFKPKVLLWIRFHLILFRGETSHQNRWFFWKVLMSSWSSSPHLFLKQKILSIFGKTLLISLNWQPKTSLFSFVNQSTGDLPSECLSGKPGIKHWNLVFFWQRQNGLKLLTPCAPLAIFSISLAMLQQRWERCDAVWEGRLAAAWRESGISSLLLIVYCLLEVRGPSF